MDLKFNTTYWQVHVLHFLVSSFLSFRCLCPLGSRPARSPMSRMVYYGTYLLRVLRRKTLAILLSVYNAYILPIIYIYTSRLLLVGTILYDIQMLGFVFF